MKDKGFPKELAAVFISPAVVETADSASKSAMDAKKA